MASLAFCVFSLLIASAHSWERNPNGECADSTCSEGTCTKCEGVPMGTSPCTMVNGFNFGNSITTSATDSSYLTAACEAVADGDSSECDNIADQGSKGACQSIIQRGGGNAVSVWVKRSCHTGQGGDADYNFCNVYNCQRNPTLAEVDGHCTERVGCQGTFMMYTKVSPQPQSQWTFDGDGCCFNPGEAPNGLIFDGPLGAPTQANLELCESKCLNAGTDQCRLISFIRGWCSVYRYTGRCPNTPHGKPGDCGSSGVGAKTWYYGVPLSKSARPDDASNASNASTHHPAILV